MATIPDSSELASHLEAEQKNIRDRLLLWGYYLLVLSTYLYALGECQDIREGESSLAVFFVHHVIAIAYVVILWINGCYGIQKCWRKENIHQTIVLLNLFLVSAYALNRNMIVFDDSVHWLCGYLVFSSLVLLSFRYYASLPRIVNRIQHFLLGSTLVLYTYLSLYVGIYLGLDLNEIFVFCMIEILFFSIAAYVFIPLLLLIGAVVLIKHTGEAKKISWAWTVAGVIVTVAVAGVFVVAWNTRSSTLEKIANQPVIYADTELPAWVRLAESLPDDWITERLIKSDIVYRVADSVWSGTGFSSSLENSEGRRKHDPLVLLASLSKNFSLTRADRIKVLRAMTDSEHKSQEMLWSGDNLTTSYMSTDVDIYPDLRLAHTKQYISIRNNYSTQQWLGWSEEATYIFQLPEGSVVTSFSLWVNGKEEKAMLTSKEKATTVYTAVVGNKQRNSSVIHWQEGNTVSVCVFSCLKDEERKFKIGITSPLPERNGRITYQHATFRGPSPADATETCRVRFIGDPGDVTLPGYFEKNVKGEYLSERSYDPDFAISWKAAPLKDNQFSVGDFTYSLQPYTPAFKSLHPTYIFLDINDSWTEEEIDVVYSALIKCTVYAFVDNEFIRLNEDNWKGVTRLLQQRNFSLFPFHHLQDTEHSLVITKGKVLSPYLRDVKESAFADGVRKFFAGNQKINVFNLSGESSTYIRSLRELRAFNFASGGVDTLSEILDTSRFPQSGEDDEHIVLHNSNMVLTRKPLVAEGNNNAPDHLVRLFAYNNIMRQVGSQFFTDDFVNEDLVNEAAEAHVVSPVSSLLVRETQRDYERFGNKDIANSLGYASRNSDRAAYQQEDLTLFILFVLFVLFNLACVALLLFRVGVLCVAACRTLYRRLWRR